MLSSLSLTHLHPDSSLQAGKGTDCVDVVAGVITDARGRILLARRTEGRDLAGLWEFPGGKREPGESPEAALIRELREELGIDVELGAPLIAVPQQYPHKRLRLDVRRIASWRGTPRGHEGQALAWVPGHKLSRYAMPPADRPVVAALLQPDRYLVTPEPCDNDRAWLDALDAALASGVLRVQLRARGQDRLRWRRLVRAAVARCRATGTQVLINGEPDLADELGVGLHLRASQLREWVHTDRFRSSDPERLLAASCHDLDDLHAAQRVGCDFAVLGPVKPTSTHPDADGIGWDTFAAQREHVSLPIYPIGGLGLQDMAQARARGAQGIAAIRAFWPAQSPQQL